VTVQQPTQVTSCCNPLRSVRHLSFNSRSARMPSFSQVQRVFTVEHCLASRFYSNCQNEFTDSGASICIKNEERSECMNRWTRCTFQTLNITLLFSDFSVIYFLTNKTCQEREISNILYTAPYSDKIFFLVLATEIVGEWKHIRVYSHWLES
jgi:hypothetical protein